MTDQSIGTWQELPFATEVYDGIEQGASDTYWVSACGEIKHISHPSGYNWRDEGDLIAQGPWMRIADDSIQELLERAQFNAEYERDRTREVYEELQNLRKTIREALGDTND